MVVVCRQLSPLCSLVERLDLVTGCDQRVGDHIEFTLFLELFWPFTAIQGLCIQEPCAAHCTCTGGAHRGKGHRGVTQPARYFLGGICNTWICPGGHTTISRRATALRSTYSYPSLGRGGCGLVIYWRHPLFMTPVPRSTLIYFLFTAPF
ncbi:hypothetical protein BC826DRAFT_733679 [Russula brevipes]|nr:hypothetical protein BC826DRAFT_733679 [Russula brevipes]